MGDDYIYKFSSYLIQNIVCIIKANWLMFFTEIIIFYCENHTNNKNTVWGRMQSYKSSNNCALMGLPDLTLFTEKYVTF